MTERVRRQGGLWFRVARVAILAAVATGVLLMHGITMNHQSSMAWSSGASMASQMGADGHAVASTVATSMVLTIETDLVEEWPAISAVSDAPMAPSCVVFISALILLVVGTRLLGRLRLEDLLGWQRLRAGGGLRVLRRQGPTLAALSVLRT